MKQITEVAPLPAKGPNIRLILGIGMVVLLVLTSSGLYLFAKGGYLSSTKSTASSLHTTTSSSGHLKVALVSDIGGLNDGGLNQLSVAGYEQARAQYGFPDVIIQSQTFSDAEYTKNLTQAAQDADMVIGVGFSMQHAIYTVASQFPQKEFALIDGCPTNPADTSDA